ncbi:hypothetical protein [Cohnella silvisoli]|uniref:Uncharacterized protein n=1 Tax=Cohnella silvisoli TaxID=2873699 RepID=A0ABV1KVP1_9BACL|nr:hypothetical protein [Cohnella silvisoli]MCD9023541.1 hypothetical protein [Cohnella silvisoli]
MKQENTFFNMMRKKNYDPLLGKGEIESDGQTVPFSLSFISARTIRLQISARMTTGTNQALNTEPSMMIENELGI